MTAERFEEEMCALLIALLEAREDRDEEDDLCAYWMGEVGILLEED